MKKKEWKYQIIRGEDKVEKIADDVFYTSDTEAFLVFKLEDPRLAPRQALLNLNNRNDGSVVSETVLVEDGVIEWEMREEVIVHAGNWQVQVIYEQLKDGEPEKYTAPIINFPVKNDLLNQKTTRLIAVENWDSFFTNAGDLVENLEELENTYQELLDTGILQTNINNKLEDLETEYAPRLTNLEQTKTEVTAQLAQTEKYIKNSKREIENQVSYNDTHRIPAIYTNTSVRQHDGLILSKFYIAKQMRINRLRFFLSHGRPNSLYELAVYDAGLNLLATSEVRQVKNGDVSNWVEVAIPEIKINNGQYYIGFINRSDPDQTNEFEVMSAPYEALKLNLLVFTSLPNHISEVDEYDYTPVYEIVGDVLIEPDGFEYSESDIRVYGSTSSTLWGWNTSTGKVCRSIDSGDTFVDLMPIPASLMGGQGLNDMLVINGRLYIQTSGGKILRTSDLTSDATWEDITAPSNLKRSHSSSRPYGMVHFNGYLFQGEYSNAPDELDGGPRILKYNVSNETWHLSGQFPNARHIHSFFTPGSAVLWVSLGDAGYGKDVGLKRLTTVNNESVDSWEQWTSMEPPRTNHYPVDFIVNPSGIWMTSDRVGKHLLYTPRSGGTVGKYNINAHSFRKNGDTGETVRSLIFDNEENAYYWTAETAEPALYVSPPPYTQSYKLKSYANSLVLNKSILSANGEYIFMFNQKIKTVKFPKKKVISSTPTIINRNYLYNDGFEKLQFEYNNVGKAKKNEKTLYLETSSTSGTSSKATYFCQLDLTTMSEIHAEFEIGFARGTRMTKISVNNSNNADDIIKQVQPHAVEFSTKTLSLDVSELTGTKFLHFQAVSSQESSIQMRIKKIWVE